MDRQLIKTLIDALDASDLTELEYNRDGTTLRLVKGSGASNVAAAVDPNVALPAPVPVVDSSRPVDTAEAGALVQAPLYGVVHLQRTPGASAFVAVGQAVESGQVLCTVEAMKVFTDVRAERAGTVGEILVTDGQEVEAGQTLIRLG